MMNRLSDYDVFLLSYDEPNANENYADLKAKFPLAKRVHGVKGFDNAHKECAKQSSTRRFITIDGDSRINDGFLDQTIPEELDKSRKVLSWDARNVVNGLVYGNGGPKCWTKEFALEMKTHEHAETDSERVDFCYDDDYKHIRGEWTTTYPNGSREQAYRAGFREGVKMALHQGVKVKPIERPSVIQSSNNMKLSVWCSVGADVENGFWCMFGARTGAYLTTTDDFDLSSISDFDSMELRFMEANLLEGEMEETFVGLGKLLEIRLDISVADLDSRGSRLFKKMMGSK
jgi:hypothetical protein